MSKGKASVNEARTAIVRESVEPAEWFVARLYSGDMTSAEEFEMRRWLDEDPAHRNAYERALRLWDSLEDLKNDEDIRRVTEAGLARRQRTAFTSRWFISAAAVVCAMFVGALVVTVLDTMRPDTDAAEIFETEIGERSTFTLIDGSEVTLNTSSRILVDFDQRQRRILLDYGEIYLDVKRDPERALSVVAGNRHVTALGTKFSVYLAGAQLEVAVTEGTVVVDDDSARFPRRSESITAPDNASVRTGGLVLTAGSVAKFVDDQKSVTRGDADDVDRLQSWRKGLVRFEDQPLLRVMSEVNRYSQLKILVEESAIADLPVSAVLDLDQAQVPEHVELLLSSLEELYPIKVLRHPDRYVLIAAQT
ncbi:MAG: FecR domain-containing protein [Gammaproteobacteria bacterium]|nr:FecR domain-containing protein [Gammaproteobacteria bacterium]